jgi:hypothetical protein
MRRSDLTVYSITSSARESSVDGSSRPSAFAVLRLITNSYLVGACTGRSVGFSPFLPASIAARTERRSRCMHNGEASMTIRRCARNLPHFRFFRKRSPSPSLNLASTRSCEPSHPPASDHRSSPQCSRASTKPTATSRAHSSRSCIARRLSARRLTRAVPTGGTPISMNLMRGLE